MEVVISSPFVRQDVVMYRRLIRLDLISQQEWRIIASFQELLKPRGAFSKPNFCHTRPKFERYLLKREFREYQKVFQ